MDSKMNNPKNIHIALVKKEDIKKDKNKRILKPTKEWEEVKDLVGTFILVNEEIFRIEEVQSKQEIKKDGMFKTEYWEIDYDGIIGLSKGLNRRTYTLRKMDYKELMKYRVAYFTILDEFEKWDIIKKK